MANPDIQDGWYRRGVELDAALEYADLRKPARIILRYVMLQVFHPGDESGVATIRQAEIARRSGQKAPNVSRGLDELLGSNILVRLGVATFRLNLDYETWLSWSRDGSRTGDRRLSDAEIRDCREAPLVFRSGPRVAPGKAGEVIPPDNSVAAKVIPPDNKKLSHRITSETGRGLKSYPTGEEKVIPPDNGNSSEIRDLMAPPLSPPSGGEAGLASIVRILDADPTSPSRPAIRNDPGEVERVVEVAARLWPTSQLEYQIRMFGSSGQGRSATYWLVDIEVAILLTALLQRRGEINVRSPWAMMRKKLNEWMFDTKGFAMHTQANCRELLDQIGPVGPPDSPDATQAPPGRPYVNPFDDDR